MTFALYDVLGNRLLFGSPAAGDARLRGSNELARHCFLKSRRIADGIALFSPRPGYLRTVFYNPDSSFERLCGNSLLIAAKHLALPGQTTTVCPFDLPPIELFHSHEGFLQVRSELAALPCSVEVPGFGQAPVYDTGSPHAVVNTTDRAVDLSELGRSFVGHSDLNLTLVERSGGALNTRTFERGVGEETAACGTGALAAAIASERFDEWLDVRYRTGRYSVRIRRAGQRLEWTLRAGLDAVQRDKSAILLQEEAGPSVSGSSSTRCST